MRYFLLIVLYSNFLFSCNINNKIPIYYNSLSSVELDVNQKPNYLAISDKFRNDDRFIATSNSKGTNISIIFTYFGRDGFLLGARDLLITGYIEVPNSSKKINFELSQEMSGWIPTAKTQYSGVATNILNEIYSIIKDEHCNEFQPFFDKIILAERNKVQAVVAGNAKEEKRRQALAKLAQEENYEKLKKVLKIKPEYRALLDDKTKTLLIGPFTLGEMSKSLRNGVSDTQMIREIEDTSFRYSSSFTFKQRNHLQDVGFSNKLIDYLELHTQEIEIQREQERRLARLERQREREIEEAQEAKEEDRRSARRARDRQEENDAGPSSSEAFASWQRDFQAGLDKDMASINKNSNQFIKQYNQTQRNSRPSSSKSNYNSSRSPTYKSNYSKSYSTDVREIKSSSNRELDEIRARKMRVIAQKEEVKPKKSGKVYKTYSDIVEDSFSSHDKKSAELNVKSGLKVKANDFCRNNGWEFADTKGKTPYISGCKEVNSEVKCNGRLEFACYKYEY